MFLKITDITLKSQDKTKVFFGGVIFYDGNHINHINRFGLLEKTM